MTFSKDPTSDNELNPLIPKELMTQWDYLDIVKATKAKIDKLEVEYRRDERIMRFLTVSLDKHALAFSEKKRSGAFNKNKETKTEEVAK